MDNICASERSQGAWRAPTPGCQGLPPGPTPGELPWRVKPRAKTGQVGCGGASKGAQNVSWEGPEAEAPPLRFGHDWGAQTPRLGAPGPQTPLPTLPSHIPLFGPRHQHKERRGSQRKGRAKPGPREGMRTFPVQVAAGCSGRKSHASVNCWGWRPAPLRGPALTPARGRPAALWLPLALAQASSLEGWAGWGREGQHVPS